MLQHPAHCLACDELAAQLSAVRESAEAFGKNVLDQKKELEARIARRDADIKSLTTALLDLRRQLAETNELVLTRQHERNLLASEKAGLEALVSQQEHAARDANLQLGLVRASRSWRLTAPLRTFVHLARRVLA
ncbi:hypothetical protein [Lysobacter niastensis]|uniref:Uncharacterized protein n=1 Tax=Lysobacter niastensis TaxID=380629 RepID=A0ABS0BAD2_9GAMM|nr:hypothetical protein [Lysobacter niastensis]MBF6025823.1 hypothetical protein [Lysobacter niastensis]